MLDSLPKRSRKESARLGSQRIIALSIFGLIVVLGPLAFGAVDRMVQAALVFLLAVGMIVYPPRTAPLGKWGLRIAVGLALLFVLKEFLPASWFGAVRWRAEAARIGLEVAQAHHPEPARALDALLVAAVAIVWLQWVRTIGAERGMRVGMAWILASAGLAVAVACFAMPAKPEAIYGLRYTPGWAGWGPFPNRNHTASLLAMAALMGLGCTVWAGMRGRKRLAVFSSLAVMLMIVALLNGKSRGGLLSLAIGLVFFCAMMLWKHRDRRAITIVVLGIALIGVVVAVFGGQALERFFSEEGKHVSNQLRKNVWANAMLMWRDAPLLGHGLQSFSGLFPFYQRLTLDDNVVLHPESSVLQWLCEIGLFPLVMGGVFGITLLAPRLNGLFKRRGSFYLAAGALAGVVAILCHSFIDVPAHRWGTAGYALALLGLACPVTREALLVGSSRRALAAIPLAISVYWLLPILGRPQPWQPVSVAQLQARDGAAAALRPTLNDWETALRYFPLDRDLHHRAALRELEGASPKSSRWQRHIEAVHRLTPGSWRYPVTHAQAVKRVSPAMCVQYWQLAVARGGWRSAEILGNALTDTMSIPGASDAWAKYVAQNPRLALAYARFLPPEQTKPLFDLWWKERAHAKDLSPDETRDFHEVAARWATGEQLLEWMAAHPGRRKEDFREWASLLHKAGMSERAWQLFKGRVEVPEYPSGSRNASREEIEMKIRLAPENTANYVELARIAEESGDAATARKVVLEIAMKKDAPSWFLRKAAYALAEEGRYAEAMEMLLREQ